jgi:hypothetical protein
MIAAITGHWIIIAPPANPVGPPKSHHLTGILQVITLPSIVFILPYNTCSRTMHKTTSLIGSRTDRQRRRQCHLQAFNNMKILNKQINRNKNNRASQIFIILHRPNQPAARHGARGFPSQPSKIMHWMYQVTWHVFEAVIGSLCWLDILILAQKMTWASQIFIIPHCPNQPAARHGARGFPSQPSKIMHWMYQVTWHVFEAVIWS